MRVSTSLESLCEQRLRGLDVPRPFRLDEFSEAVARARGRPLHILTLPELDGDDDQALTGVLISTEDDDWVFASPGASPWHRDLIVLHEIAHLLCGHGADAQWPRDHVQALLPELSDQSVQHALTRHAYTGAQEREAEQLASLILARADADPLGTDSAGREGVAGRLTHTLRHPVRHV